MNKLSQKTHGLWTKVIAFITVIILGAFNPNSGANAQDFFIFGYSATPQSNCIILNGVEIPSLKQGWYHQDGSHTQGNDNYLCGYYDKIYYRNFHAFDLSDLSSYGVTLPITSAALKIQKFGSIPASGYAVWDLFSVSNNYATIDQTYQAGTAGQNIFNDLGSGSSYGSGTIDGSLPNSAMVDVHLNNAAVNAINNIIGGIFVIGGKSDNYLSVTPPEATTNNATGIESNLAVLNGSVNANGTNTNVTFRYGTSSGNLTEVVTATPSSINSNLVETVNASVTGLIPSTTYYFQVRAENTDGAIVNGNEISFTTLELAALPPTVSTNTVSEVTNNTATSGGNITNDGDSTITSRGVCWNTTGNPTILDATSNSGTGAGNFTSPITGLSAGTTYYVKAYATNSVGTGYGDEVSFTTLLNYSGGSGTIANPYQIARLEDLKYLSEHPEDWDAYFIQMADIDASATSSWNGGKGFDPIGWIVSFPSNNDPFTGFYDGNEKTINNLYINRPSEGGVGLFGYINGATVRNLGMNNANITGSGNTGTLFGTVYTGSHVEGCWVTGTVKGNNTAGGFAGNNYKGTILDCYARVNVINDFGTSYVGGFIAFLNGTLTNVYAAGQVSGANANGLVGNFAGGPITSSYWDTQASGVSISPAGTGRTTEEMQIEDTYSGWNFSSIWSIDPLKNDGYPYLSWQSFVMLTTSSVTAIESNSATGGGEITDDDGNTFSAIGLCWNTSGTPTILDNKTTNGSVSAPFSGSITGLEAKKKYFVRAYATTSGGVTYYGNEESFTTANGVPVANDFTASPAPYQNVVYSFYTSDFGYADGESDPLNHIRIVAIPSSGRLYVDGAVTENDAFDVGEELANGAMISKADLDAGNLQYYTTVATNTSFKFAVNDGIDYSASTYNATLNTIPAVKVSITAQTNVSCNGENDGSLTATVTPGAPNYSYVWSNGSSTFNSSATTNTISSLNAGAYSVIVTDLGGNKDTASAIITQPAKLVASVVADSMVSCYGESDGGMTASVIGGTSPYSYLWSNGAKTTSVSGVAAGTYNVTVTDFQGCESTASIEIVVIDTFAPVAGCKDINVFLDTDGSVALNSLAIENGSTDNCGIFSHTLDINSFNCGDIGENIVTMTVSDFHSNSASCQSVVTVLDTISPTVQTKDITVYLDESGFASIDSSDIDNGSSDNCSIATMTLDITEFNCSNIGENTVTLTVTDPSGNVASNTAIVTIVDSTEITIEGPSDITVQNDPGQCGAVVTFESPIVIDNCTEATFKLTEGFASGSVFPVGTTQVKFTISSMITDAIPTINLASTATGTPMDVAYNPEKDLYYSVTGGYPGVPIETFNNEGTLLLKTNNSNHDWRGLWWNPNTNKLEGNAYNSVGIKNQQLDSDGYATSEGSIVLPGLQPDYQSQGAYNYEDDQIIYYSNGNIYRVDRTTNTYLSQLTITGLPVPVSFLNQYRIGYSGINKAEIMVYDYQNKQIHFLNKADGSYTSSCQLPAEAPATSSMWNVGFANNQIFIKNSNTWYGYRYYTQSVDTSYSFSVTVQDTEQPVVNTQSVSLYLDEDGLANISASDVDNSSSDNCGIASMSVDITGFDCNDMGANPVTLTVTDENGNWSTGSSNVTVLDTIKPTVICKDITLNVGETGIAIIDSSFPDNGSYDVCGIAGMSLSKTKFIGEDTGANLVELSVADVNGNVASCISTVTVMDTVAPEVWCQDIGIVMNEDGTARIYPGFVLDSVFDAGGIASYSLDKSKFDCSNVGTNVVELIATDFGGNIARCSANVEVYDNFAPVVLCNDLEVYLNEDGIAEVEVSMVEESSDDACGIAEKEISQSIFTDADLGDNTVNLYVIDVNGNVGSCESKVTVNDTIAPLVACNPISIWLSPGKSYQLTEEDVAALAAGSFDNATAFENLIIEVVPGIFECENIGDSVPVTVSVTDKAGNESSCETKVFVSYSANKNLEDIRVDLPAGVCETTVDYPAIFTGESCATLTLLDGLGADGVFPVGTTVETWEVALEGAKDTVSFSVTVNSANALPTLDPVADVTASEDEHAVISLTGISDGGDCIAQELSISAVVDNTDLIENTTVVYTSNESSAELELSLATNQTGVAQVVVRVTDEEGAFVTDTFMVFVQAGNHAPVLINPVADQEVEEGTALNLALSKVPGEVFTDPDGDELVWSFTVENDTVPAWMEVTETAGEFVFDFTPQTADTGCYNIIVAVEDPAGATATDTFELCVLRTITGIGDINEGLFAITMYPNPTTGKVYVGNESQSNENIAIIVFSASGSEVLRKEFRASDRIQFDLSDQVAGFYLVSIKQGERQVVKKLILDRK